MAKFGDRLKTLRTEHHLSQDELSKILGVSKQAISQYERGLRFPKDYEQIADYFNVDLDYLLGRSDVYTKLIYGNAYAHLNGVYPFEPGKYRIPIVATVAAGQPIYAEDNIDGYIDYDKDPQGHVFACRIKGDSMTPKISDGDIIVVDQESSWENNDIVVVTINEHDAVCKRIRKYAEGIQLISLNPSYEPMTFTQHEVDSLPIKIVGRVMEARSKF
ncbi:MAG TPA: XRE family transcriptional regulator [Lachnospiraceae bacterium]